VEEVLNSRECLTQLMHQLAQVVAGLRLGCVRPEEEGETMARLGHVAMQDEIGEQGLHAHRVEVRYRLVAKAHAEIAEQPDV
jgi:hypothetical protein